jgi:hypothetical protein
MESGSQPDYTDPTIAAINNVIGTLGAESTAALGAAAAAVNRGIDSKSIDPQPGSPRQSTYHDRYGAGALPNMDGGPRMTVDEWEEDQRRKEEDIARRRAIEEEADAEWDRKQELRYQQLAEQLPAGLRQRVDELSAGYTIVAWQSNVGKASRAVLLADRLRSAEEVERFRGMSTSARQAYVPELAHIRADGSLDSICDLAIFHLNAQTEEA